MNVKPFTANALAAAVAAVLAQPATAQQEGANEGALEEIVVTATRREQNLQDVPIAVVAYTGEMLETQGIENMEDLKAVVPNVIIAGNIGGSDTASFTMRGIPNVGTYIDGIWQVSNNGLLLREFVDLDRVEVLRGPQGTLYGRDSTGGAIRLYTKAPSPDYGVQVDMAVGNLDRRDLKGSLDLPFTEKFRSRFTLANYDRDGYITSLTTGQVGCLPRRGHSRGLHVGAIGSRESAVQRAARRDHRTQARVKTYIDPQIAWNSGFQVGLVEAYDIASGGQWNCHYVCSGNPAVPSGSGKSLRNHRAVAPEAGAADARSRSRVTGTEWLRVPRWATRSSTPAVQRLGSGEFNFYIDYFLNETDLTSHEFQFSGGGDRFEWVGGAYVWDQDRHSRNPALVDGRVGPPGPRSELPDDAADFRLRGSDHPNPSCTTATPAIRGITSWAPRVAAGYVPPFALGLDVNSVAGWPFPCKVSSTVGLAGSARSRPARGRRPAIG